MKEAEAQENKARFLEENTFYWSRCVRDTLDSTDVTIQKVDDLIRRIDNWLPRIESTRDHPATKGKKKVLLSRNMQAVLDMRYKLWRGRDTFLQIHGELTRKAFDAKIEEWNIQFQEILRESF